MNVFAIRLPPLRDRRDDILPLTQCFLDEFGRAFANPPAGISREARQLLLALPLAGQRARAAEHRSNAPPSSATAG